MLKRSRSASICDGLRKTYFVQIGRGLLPLLALMLLAAPQLAFAQNDLRVTVNPRSLDIDESGSGTYTVVLNAEPAEDVVVKVVGAPEGVDACTDCPLYVSSSTLTFTTDGTDGTNGWNVVRTVTVTAPEDDNAVDETVRLTHTATVGEDGDEVTLRNATVTVSVDDNDDQRVRLAPDPATLTIAETESETYTVVLTSKPTATVTVDVGGISGEITVSPSRLFFVPDAWATAQTVTVYTGEDFDAVDDTATLTHTVRGGDYTGVPAKSVEVTVTDDDEEGVTVSTTALAVVAGTSDTYTVVLDTQPTKTVTITMSEDSDDVTVSPARLSFTASDWSRPKTVRVTVRSGGASGTTVTHTAASSDTGYESVTVDDVGVTIPTAPTRLTVSRSSMRIAEGQNGTYTVRLPSAPDADVVVSVAVVTSPSDLSVDSASLTFTPDGGGTPWNVAQTVTVSAAEDEDGVDDVATVTHTVSGETAVSQKLAVTVADNDRRGVTVTPTSLEIPEGADATYTVVLDTKPTDRVTVAIAGASGDINVKPSQLTFTTTNWFSAQEVMVSAAQDDDGVQDPAVTLRHTVRGGDYDRLSRVSNVTVTIAEDDTRSLTVSTGSLTIMEGKTGTYTVKLDSRPTGTVTVMVRGASGDVTVDPSRLVFTTGTWNTPQEVEVTAGQDADAEPDSVVTLTHAASGGGFDGVTGGTVTVTITEDDEDRKGVSVWPTALTVDEGGPAMSYTVVLNSEPTGTVAVSLGGLTEAAAQSLVVTPTRLTFTRGNWSIPQTVTVRASEDDDGNGTEDTPVTLTHGVTGGGYGGEMPSSVMVTVRDNDTPGLLVTPMDLQIPAGSSRTYTVALATKPTADVTVAVTGTGVTISPASLTFTQANWKQKKTVTLHAAANADTADVVVTNAPSGEADYATSVLVNVKTVSAATEGVAVSPNKLTITEGESGSYTVVLTKAPSGTVTIGISGAAGDVSVNPTRLSFSTGNWNRQQTVRVRVAEDDDADTDTVVMLKHTVTGGGYEDATADNVEVTPKEDDTRRVTVNPTLLTIAAGVSGTYQVRLETQPSDDVTVMVDSPTKDVTVNPTLLVFTSQNWSRNQAVTVTVDEDAGGTERKSVILTHVASGGDYAGVDIPDVTVAIPVEGTPGAPRGLSVTGGDRRATLSWTAPSSDGGSAIVRYEYRVQQTGSDFTAWRTVTGGASATSYTVTGLENGTAYTFEVRAVNNAGAGQPVSTSATLAESAPGAPTGLTATGGDEQITLSWNAPSTGGSQILRYEYRSRRSGGSWSDWVANSTTSVTIGNLTNGDRYDFEVRAVNSVGDGPAAATSGTPGTPPSAPTGLTPRAEDEAIKVTWDMPADTGGSVVTRFEIRYRMSDQEFANSESGWITVSGGARTTSYTFGDLTNGVAYVIEVRAVNAVGAGAVASVVATPMEGIDFAHFANGQAGGVTITSEIVLVNVENSTVTPAIYFYNQQGDMIDADSVVDVDGTEALRINGDGALTTPMGMGIARRGEMTISTTGEGDLVVGSVRVFGTGRLGGVLRFDLPSVGVAGVGASEPVNDAIFPARRMAGGINTGAAIRNLSSERMTVTCMLMQGGEVMDTQTGQLLGDGQVSRFINEMFPGADTTDFVGSVRCTAPDGGMFVGVALELDAANGIFTTLPVVPLGTGSGNGESMLNFAHFANGDFGGTATSSDLVFVNVANSAVSPAIYFYDQMGNMIDASMVVDEMMEGVEVSDGVLMVTTEIASMGERTISTSGMGNGMVGSVKVVSDGPIGGVLRFDIPTIGVAGVGASEAVNSAIFPARRMADGINTGAAIRNLESEMATVTCLLRSGGQRIGEAVINLAANGQNSEFINEMFPNANTNNFEGSVHCTAPSGMMFTGVALEMDFNNRIFTTLPVVPVR